MKSFIRFFGTLFALFLLFSAVFFIDYWHFMHSPLNIASQGYVFDFPYKSSTQDLVEELAEKGVLQSPLRLLLWIRATGSWNQLKAGEYCIKPGSTPIDLIEQLKSGKVIQHSLTIVPGWTVFQMMQAIQGSPYLKHTLIGKTSLEMMAILGYPNQHPEGRFFPETYYFPKGTTDVAFLRRAYTALEQKLTHLWKNRSDSFPLKSVDEALILASIIEKESRWVQEYAEISGVYIRRLEKKMPLQADPTLIYGMGSEFSGGITRTMLSTPSPYNTYLKTGLPPTPIALPSQWALEAAFNPKPGNSLYFVVNPEGNGHVFSDDLKSHQNAVKKYRQSILGK